MKSEPESTYSCYAALHHIGGSTDEGHYTATAFHSVSSLWYVFVLIFVSKLANRNIFEVLRCVSKIVVIPGILELILISEVYMSE